MTKKKKLKDRRWWRITKKVLLFLFIFQFVYILYGKWFNPPITFTQMGDFIMGHGLKRTYVNYSEISPNVKLALIASEDQAFTEHSGFDWSAMGKAVKGESKHGFGGTSTLSQQVAKNYFLWQGWGPLKYVRKVPEFYFTKMIEWVWGKKRILEAYLNICEFGDGIFGIEAAAKHYFNKSAKNLSRVEAAQIVACLPNPKVYKVKPMGKFVSWKHKWILHQMRNIENDKAIKALVND
jgi:monofunctional glycosyltransferase